MSMSADDYRFVYNELKTSEIPNDICAKIMEEKDLSAEEERRIKDIIKKKKINKLGFKIFSALGFVCIVVGVMWLLGKWLNELDKIAECKKVTLYSVDMSSELTEDFVLGNGSDGETYYYVAYETTNDNQFELCKMPKEITTIYRNLDNGESAYAMIYLSGFDDIKKVDLYVPQNTILSEYDLSLWQ